MKPKISFIKIFLFTIGVSITTSKDICLVGAFFFLFLFLCHVRRYPKTGFWSFKKKFPVYPSTSNIFRGMNSWIFTSTLSSVKSVPKSVSRKERPTERASRRRSPKKNSDINFFAGTCQIFEKKWQSFAEKERKIPLLLAKIRVFTLKWVFFALKSDFSQNFRGKKRPHHVESVAESVRRASTM